MKFTVVAVLLALALGANASILPLGLVGGPWGSSIVVDHAHGHAVPGVPGSVAIQAAAVPHVLGAHVVAGPGPVQVVSGPLAHVHAHGLAHAHGIAHAHAHVVADPHVVAHAGTFVAKTRGAVHVAPLAGHTQSVVSANLQPAPGTI